MKKTLLLPIFLSFCFICCTELQAQRNKKNPEAFNFELRAQAPFMFDWDSFSGQYPLKFEDSGFGLHVGLGYRINTTMNFKLFGEVDYLVNNPDRFTDPNAAPEDRNDFDYFSFATSTWGLTDEARQNLYVQGQLANDIYYTNGNYALAGDPAEMKLPLYFSGGGNYRTIKIGFELQQDLLPGRKICPMVSIAPYMLFLHQNSLIVSRLTSNIPNVPSNPDIYMSQYDSTGAYDDYYVDSGYIEDLANGYLNTDDQWLSDNGYSTTFPWNTQTYNTVSAGIQSSFGFKFWQILTLSANLNTFYVPNKYTGGLVAVSLVPQLGVHIPISYKKPKDQ